MAVPDLPRQDALVAAAALDIELPEACIDGVVTNRALLDRHLATLEDALARHPDA